MPSPKVTATIWPDLDPDSTIDFDCTELLDSLPEEMVVGLISHDWKKCNEADHLAYQSGDKDVRLLLDNLGVLHKYNVECSFEVEVDRAQAEAWLAHKWPALQKREAVRAAIGQIEDELSNNKDLSAATVSGLNLAIVLLRRQLEEKP